MPSVVDTVNSVKEKNKGSSSLASIMDSELKDTETELKLSRARRMLREERGMNMGNSGEKADNIGSAIAKMAESSPEKLKEFLESLDEDTMQKFLLLSSGSKEAGTVAALMRNPGSSIKDIISIVNAIRPQDSGPKISLDIGDLLKTVMDRDKGGSGNTTAVIQMVLDRMQSLQDMVVKNEMLRMENEIKELKANQPDMVTMLTSKKAELEGLRDLFGGAVVTGNDPNALEIQKMRLDNDRWRLEQTWAREDRMAEMGLKASNERQKMKMIQGFIAQTSQTLKPIIEGATGAAKRRLEKTGDKTAAVTPPVETFECDECHTSFPVEGDPDKIVCPKCKKEFNKIV